MQNWQDYATNSSTNSSHKPIPPKLAAKKSPSSANRPPKGWFYFNIFLTLLCTISLTYGAVGTLMTHQSLAQIPSNLAITLIVPGIAIPYLILPSETVANPTGLVIIGLFISIALGIAIIINAVLAFVRYCRHQDPKSFAAKNLIFALLPPLYIIIVLIIFFLNLH